MIQAARLVGAEAMIVGVRGDMARVFVGLGEFFAGARTFSTLAEGLRHALRWAEKPLLPLP